MSAMCLIYASGPRSDPSSNGGCRRPRRSAPSMRARRSCPSSGDPCCLQSWDVAEDLASRLRSPDSVEVDAALVAVVAHPDGDRLLADYVLSEKPAERLFATAVLGDLSGSDGTAALRRLAQTSGPGSRDLRCASLLALAKRCGEKASAELTQALSDRDAAVKDYAVIGLAGAGDGRAWDHVRARLGVLLGRPSRTHGQTEVLMAVAYLLQHSTEQPGRLTLLVDTLRKKWGRMNNEELAWFAELWPDVFPGGPPSAHVTRPDPNRVRAWARDPLFGPIPMPGRRPRSSSRRVKGCR